MMLKRIKRFKRLVSLPLRTIFFPFAIAKRDHVARVDGIPGISDSATLTQPQVW